MNKNGIYDNIPEGYYDVVHSKKNGIQFKWHDLKFKKIYQLINDLNPTEVLDVACGPGTFIGNCSSIANFTGIDIAEKQIEYANKKYGNKNKNFVVCENAKFPFLDNSFDLITSIEFIEHISSEDFESNLLEMNRCLKPGGTIILTTPNYYSLWPILEILVSKITSQNYLEQHISHYNKSLLLKKLNKFNFRNANVSTYLLFAPFFAIFGNSISDLIFNIETKLKIGFGNLLLAKIKKINL